MNPLFQAMNGNAAQSQPTGNPQIMQSIKRMVGMLNGVQSPEKALQMLAQQNPLMAQVMQMTNGRDPKQVFYEMCNQKGVNPDDILSQLK